MRRSGLSILFSDRLWVVVSFSFIGIEGYFVVRFRLCGVSLVNGGIGRGCRGLVGVLRRVDMWFFRLAILIGLKGRGVCVCVYCVVCFMCVYVVCTCVRMCMYVCISCFYVFVSVLVLILFIE